ncbi:MAG: hypothetical protein IJ629_05415 [Clostridia bacterium]|nr:hypothetical protein [Clostridia bacterium]
MPIKARSRKLRAIDVTVYVILRTLVILVLIAQIINRNYENVFLCVLTLILFLVPFWMDRRWNIKIPTFLEIMIFLFIFASEILGEVAKFYVYFKHWDTILHTMNGFLAAAIGFSLIDILNRSERFHLQLSPIFVAMIAFCFSMTIGILWEFYEYSYDVLSKHDMQKDEIVTTIASVSLDGTKSNKPVVLENVDKTVIYSKDKDGKMVETTISGGYLDIGLRDTMEDLFVNFLGAYSFSIIGWLYIHNRDKYKFAENFMPKRKTEKEIEETKAEIARMEQLLELKRKRKRVAKLIKQADKENKKYKEEK